MLRGVSKNIWFVFARLIDSFEGSIGLTESNYKSNGSRIALCKGIKCSAILRVCHELLTLKPFKLHSETVRKFS